MTRILDLGSNPVLGRVHAVNRKHRLRSKHYAAVNDWPESGATIDVLDASALDAMDHYPCTDQVFVVSAKLLAVLQGLDGEIEAHELDAGGRTVYLVMPVSDSDVMYEADGYPAYSRNGYSIVDGKDLRVGEEPDAVFCAVRNTGIVALRDDLVAAAAAAGVTWSPTDVIASYRPFRHHPYHVFRTGYATAVADSVEVTSEWPAAPESVAHPLGAGARDGEFDDDPDEAWTEALHGTDSFDDALFTRYCSGLALPTIAAQLDDDIAKSKVAKRWKETLAAGCLHLEGLPCVSGSIRDRLVEAGVEASFETVTLSDPKSGGTTEFFLVQPTHVVEWIDWSRSDVALLWNGLHDEYFDLQPTEDSYTATLPLVRVAGSNLLLVHETLAVQLTDAEGFYMTPLHELAAARNLDGGIGAR